MLRSCTGLLPPDLFTPLSREQKSASLSADTEEMTNVPAWLDGIAFTVAHGRELGLTEARMRRPEVLRPYHGVRVSGTAGRVDSGVIDRCADLRVVLDGDAYFSHATAARLWGIPLPQRLADEIHVLTVNAAAVRRPGVVGWRRAGALPDVRVQRGLPVAAPADTWVMLATMTAGRGGVVEPEWLVAAADFLISGKRTRWGRETPLATADDLAHALRRHGSGRGARALAWALERVRSPVDSPRETLLRLGLVREGLPEPVVQPAVLTAAGWRHPDLGYLDHRTLIEYLGDVHRTDRHTWLRDLERVQLFEDAGYRVILAAGDDVTVSGMPAFADRVRRALERAESTQTAR